MANAANIEQVREKLKGKRRHEAMREEKVLIGLNYLKKRLLGMGVFATTKVMPSGKLYRRAAGRKFVATIVS